MAESLSSVSGVRNEAQLNVVKNRVLTLAGNTLLAVAGGAVTATFTFPRAEPNVDYIAVATPSWSTTVYVLNADKLTTSCRFSFGTAPVGAETLNVLIMRSES
jgi:hypothetical protein